MNILIDIARKIRAAWIGNAFAKSTGPEDNGMTIYRFSGRADDKRNSGKGKRLQPVVVKVK